MCQISPRSFAAARNPLVHKHMGGNVEKFLTIFYMTDIHTLSPSATLDEDFIVVAILSNKITSKT